MRSKNIGLAMLAAIAAIGCADSAAALGGIATPGAGGANPLRSRNGKAPGANMAFKRKARKLRNRARA
jgi:hypothetical protein